MKKFVVGERLTMGSDAFKNYLSEIGKIKLFDNEEYNQVISEMSDEDPEIVKKAKLKLVNNSLRFVVSVAKQYMIGKHDINDLISEGNIGLLKAAEKYDPTTNIKFLSYAVWWVRKYIIIYVNSSSLIKVPIHKTDNLIRLKEFQRDFVLRNSRNPELEDFLVNGLKLEDYEFLILSKTLDTQSLDIEIDTDDGTFRKKDTIASDYFNDIETNETNEMNSFKIENLLNVLGEREKLIISDLFGIGGTELDTVQVAKKHGICKERIRQIKDESLKKMRKHYAIACI